MSPNPIPSPVAGYGNPSLAALEPLIADVMAAAALGQEALRTTLLAVLMQQTLDHSRHEALLREQAVTAQAAAAAAERQLADFQAIYGRLHASRERAEQLGHSVTEWVEYARALEAVQAQQDPASALGCVHRENEHLRQAHYRQANALKEARRVIESVLTSSSTAAMNVLERDALAHAYQRIQHSMPAPVRGPTPR